MIELVNHVAPTLGGYLLMWFITMSERRICRPLHLAQLHGSLHATFGFTARLRNSLHFGVREGELIFTGEVGLLLSISFSFVFG